MTMDAPDRRSPERRALEALIAEQTKAVNEARGALEDVVPELQEGNASNRKLAIIGIVVGLIVAAAVGLSLWAVTSSQSAQSQSDANTAAIAATAKANHNNCVSNDDFRRADARRWAVILSVIAPPSAPLTPEDQARVNRVSQANAAADAQKNCDKLYPLPKQKAGVTHPGGS